MSESVVSIFALGGLGEIGKNMYVIQFEDEIVVVDSGGKFPEEDMPGIDLVIPDISYLIQHKGKIKGIFLTHGHEDHIGALPYVLKQVNVPVYGAALTIGLVEAKLKEHRLLRETKLHVIDPEQTLPFEKISLSFFRTNHTIPDSLGIAVHTPHGTVVHTGDFKFDLTPIGNSADIAKMAQLGENKQVLALLSDSTNSEREGGTPSEKVVGEAIDHIFHLAQGRILFSTFASNVYRLQQVVQAAVRYRRKIALIGRSMEKVFEIAQRLGYIKAPEGMLIDARDIDRYKAEEIVILCTGSQGEPMAALTRIAQGSHRMVKIIPGDTVVYSSSPIPGNDVNINRSIDLLFRAGADVKYGSHLEIHASGHGSQEDLKLMLNLMKPKYFIPIHGEYRMLVQHAKLAEEVGIASENTFILENGDVFRHTKSPTQATVIIERNKNQNNPSVQSGIVLVDGSGIGDVGNIVLRDRKRFAQDGIMIVVLTVDMKERKVLAGPDLVTRGFVYVRESEDMMREATQLTRQTVHQLLEKGITSWAEWKQQISNTLTPYFISKTNRSPMMMTIIMEPETTPPLDEQTSTSS
ncbi:ribonuclease J [Ammoniphilus sp. CFH 90114]|uniref:ribonuclease J1 n=1 Tax=Ammoniphilus sp. CFH 90114 TaxID=2493665 RepID=UPI00100DB974|nr:ribonuclease J [Ammoniphilus sp. CFH 90114]RXT05651.1 ribonuclease J [Ammoniphilus sp. CFH 90114]